MKKEVEDRLKFLGKATGHGSLEFSPDCEFSVLANKGKSGYWSIGAVDKSRSPTGLAIHYSTYTKDIGFSEIKMGYVSVLEPIDELDADQLEGRVPRTDGSQIRFGDRKLYPEDP